MWVDFEWDTLRESVERCEKEHVRDLRGGFRNAAGGRGVGSRKYIGADAAAPLLCPTNARGGMRLVSGGSQVARKPGHSSQSKAGRDAVQPLRFLRRGAASRDRAHSHAKRHAVEQRSSPTVSRIAGETRPSAAPSMSRARAGALQREHCAADDRHAAGTSQARRVGAGNDVVVGGAKHWERDRQAGAC